MSQHLPEQWPEEWHEADEWHVRSYDPPALDRLTHLVLVDGRLVDLWTQSVRGTRWQEHADRFDAERRPLPEPDPPAHEQALRWLRSLVGSDQALAALDDSPLSGLPPIPDGLSLPARRRYEEIREHLDGLARRVFADDEVRCALHHGLLLTWTHQPSLVTGTKTSAQVAGQVALVVGKANGLFGPVGPLTQKEVAGDLGLKSLQTQSGSVESAIRGFREAVHRPWRLSLPDLMALGEPTLLLSSTRRDIRRWRDRALAAQATATGG